MSKNQLHTIGSMQSLADETTIDLTGVMITKAELKTTKTNKTYHAWTIEGPEGKAYCNCFGNGTDIINRPVTITNLKVGTYNGKRNLMGGKFTVVMEGDQTPLLSSEPPVSAPQPPIPSNSGRFSAPPPSRPSPTPAGPHGATVGMAVKAGVDVWINGHPGKAWDNNTATDVYNVAKKILEISAALEKGEDFTAEVPF